jgi:hypothetical protein
MPGRYSNRIPRPPILVGHAVAATHAAQKAIRPVRPGVERWPVKTGTDPDATQVTAGHVQTTVDELIHEPRPHDMVPPNQAFPAYQERRAFGVETTVFRVEVTIIAYKEESDGDYHLVIQGAGGHTMIAECPNPDPAFVDPASEWATEIKEVRAALDGKLNPAPAMHLQKASVPAIITGVGFFDRIHGQDGVATTNGIELHPIVEISFP